MPNTAKYWSYRDWNYNFYKTIGMPREKYEIEKKREDGKIRYGMWFCLIKNEIFLLYYYI